MEFIYNDQFAFFKQKFRVLNKYSKINKILKLITFQVVHFLRVNHLHPRTRLHCKNLEFELNISKYITLFTKIFEAYII